LLAFAGCASGPEPATFPAAQAIVDQVTARHQDIVRLSIHAVPPGTEKSRVVASNVKDKLDDWSDPEDIKAMETKQPVTMDEGKDLDYTAPVIDSSGKAIGAVGVTVKGTDRAKMLSSAQAIAREVSTAILSAPSRPW
jgi:hypothetical protein